MGTVAKAYTTTIVAGLVANASNVRRALDDVYSAVNGGLDSANLSTTFKSNWFAASQISVADTATLYSDSTVEDCLREAASLGGGAASAVQDFTVIGAVGCASQQFAGHHLTTEDPGTTAADVLALYLFQSASMTTDEKGTYTLTNVCQVANTAGPMGTAGYVTEAYGAYFGGTSTDQCFTCDLLDSAIASGLTIDFWFRADEGVTSGSGGQCQVFFRKVNVDNSESIEGGLTSGGIGYFYTLVNGSADTIYTITALASGCSNWHYMLYTHDGTYGKRLYMDSLCENTRASETTIMESGSDGNFTIGALSATNVGNFRGTMAYFRVRDKIITQRDVDIGYAVKYTMPTGTTLDHNIKAYVRTCASSELEHQSEWVEIARNTASLYRAGGIYATTDSLKITTLGG
jgi:hypothetical protein